MRLINKAEYRAKRKEYERFETMGQWLMISVFLVLMVTYSEFSQQSILLVGMSVIMAVFLIWIRQLDKLSAPLKAWLNEAIEAHP